MKFSEEDEREFWAKARFIGWALEQDRKETERMRAEERRKTEIERKRRD